MTTPKYKEGGHARAERLDLGKPHIMWCRHLGLWVLASYSWRDTDVDQSMIGPALGYMERLEERWTPRSHK